MKRPSAQQVQNFIFTGIVMLAASAVLIYLAIKKERASSMTAEISQSPQLTVTSEPSDAEARFLFSPLSVFKAQITGDGTLSIREDGDGRYTLELPDGYTAALEVTESDGAIQSLLWTFAPPVEVPRKPQNEIEERLAEQGATCGLDAVSILDICIRAADLNGTLPAPILNEWCNGVLKAFSDGKAYRDTARGCIFSAYRSELDDGAFVCSLLPPV